MSWLQGTLGEGFSSLKGQITKITKEVLAEDSEGDEEKPPIEIKLKELEAFCDSQSLEISVLRDENLRLKKINEGSGNFFEDRHNKVSKFDLVDQSFELSDQTLQSVCKLENELAEVNQEKANLVKSLEELDIQHQNEMRQVLSVKQDLKLRVEHLENQNMVLMSQLEGHRQTDDVESLKQELKTLSLDYEVSVVDIKKKDELIASLKYELDSLRSKIMKEELEKEASFQKINNEIKEQENIKKKLEKLVSELKISNEEYVNVDNAYKSLKVSNEKLESDLRQAEETIQDLKIQNTSLESELGALKVETTKLLEDKYLFDDITSELQDKKKILDFVSLKLHSLCGLNDVLNLYDVINILESKWTELCLTVESKAVELGKIEELVRKVQELELEKTCDLHNYEKVKSEKLENEKKLLEELNLVKEKIHNKDMQIQDLVLQVENLQNNKSQTDDVKRLEQEIKKLVVSLQLKEQEYKECNQTRTNLETEMNVLKSLTAKTEQQLSNLMKEKEILNTEVSQWRNTVQSKEEQYMSLFQEMNVLRDKNSSLQKSLEEYQQLELSLNDLVTKLTEQNNILQTESENVAKEFFETYERKINDFILSLRALEKEIKQLTSEKLELESENKKLNDIVTDRESQIIELVENLKLREMNKTEENSQMLIHQTEEQEMQSDTNLELANLKREKVLYETLKLDHAEVLQKCDMLTSKLEELKLETNKIEMKGPEMVDVENKGNEIELELSEYKKQIELLNYRIAELESNTKTNNQDINADELSAVNNALQNELMKNKILQNECQTMKDKEVSLKREVERLRLHLVEVEDHYTSEAVKTEKIMDEMKQKLNNAEERLKSSSTVYTSQSIRANQHVESLQSQIKLISVQRDDLQSKLSAAEDDVQKNQAALKNLQFVLEQFQDDKEREIHNVHTKYECQLQIAKRQHQEYEEEIKMLNKQLSEAKDGLKAASRLGEKLEKKSNQISKLEETISQLEDKLKTAESNITLTNQTNISKVDKSLVKNLVVGYISSQKPEHKTQVLRIMANVLDFNQDERNKTGVDHASSGWLSKFLHPNSEQTSSNQSLSEAFIKFLESESRPQPQIKLLPETSNEQVRPVSRTSPILMSDFVLPSFAPSDAQERSSILKDVLKDS